MTEEGKRVKAASPGHISGFFAFQDDPDPLFRGSTGAGVAIERGVVTVIDVSKASATRIKVLINGLAAPKAIVSRDTAYSLLSISENQWNVTIRHQVDVPVGAGYGSSGAAALSLAVALNRALRLGLTDAEAASFAHLSEISHKTGLGTVLAEFHGGVTMRVFPGAPTVGKVQSIPASSNVRVVSLTFGAIPTSRFLKKRNLLKRSTALGARLLDELKRDPTLKRLMELSRVFTEELGIATPRVQKILKKTDNEGVVFTMAMFGETVFTVIDEGQVEYLAGLDFIRKLEGTGRLVISRVSRSGVRIV